MNRLTYKRRLVLPALVAAPLLAAFAFAALRTGPLAPIPVTVVSAAQRTIAPALFGTGTVEARFAYRIGPTAPGRIRSVAVHVGDRVRAGELLGEMDPVDLDARIDAQQAALRRAEAEVRAVRAVVADGAARREFAQSQARRYEQLYARQVISADALEARRQEAQTTAAGHLGAQSRLEAAERELRRIDAERGGLIRQRETLRLTAPVEGLVTARRAEPGTTAVAGEAVVEMIDPASVWINVRFDQLGAAALTAGLAAEIALRSRPGALLAGRVLRVEPLADAVTEELLAKVVFDPPPQAPPPVGELVEVTVRLPPLQAAVALPNAAVRRIDGRLGVWVAAEGGLRFHPVRIGVQDLDGQVQIRDGLQGGERVVVHSLKALKADSRIRIVERIPGVG
jgi:RND family efflux transporter MFP subunit